MRYKLQDYSDGTIYKLDNRTYEVETSQGKGTGTTVAEALKNLSNLLAVDRNKAQKTRKNKKS